jgi:hypothetical protein
MRQRNVDSLHIGVAQQVVQRIVDRRTGGCGKLRGQRRVQVVGRDQPRPLRPVNCRGHLDGRSAAADDAHADDHGCGSAAVA